MKHRLKNIFVIFILVTSLLTGCWDSTDINAKNISTAIAIDMKNDNYIFSTEIAKLIPEKNGNGGSEKFTTIQGEGKTFAEARQSLNYKHANPLYIGTISILILTTSMAKGGIEEYLYRLRNLHEYRKTTKVVTTSEDPKELFEIQQNSDISTGHVIDSMIENYFKSGESISISATELLEWLSSDNQDFLIPNIDIADDTFTLSGYSVIHRAVYSGFIPAEDAKGIVILLNDNTKLILAVPFEDREATAEVKLKNKKINVEYEDNKLTFDIELKFDSVIKYLNNKILYGEKENEIVKKNLNEILYKEVQKAIDQSQKEFKCDFLRFNEYFRIKYPNNYKYIDWYGEYPKSEINITIENELDPGGEFDYKATIK